MELRDGIVVVYAFSAIFAVAACWLWFRYIVRKDERKGGSFTAPGSGLESAGTSAALSLGLAGFGFLLSLVI